MEIGQPLLAFEREPQLGNRIRRWEWATVTRSERATKECVRVHLSNGDAIDCSMDHPWLTTDGFNSHGLRWTKAAHLSTGIRVQRVMETWETDESYDGGWLSGMFDGEGCLSMDPFRPQRGGGPLIRLSISQKPGPVLDQVCELLDRRKFDYTLIAPSAGSSAAALSIRGGQGEILRALGTLRPIRLLNNWRQANMELRSTRAVNGPGVTVVAVDWLGHREVQSIATSSGTYVGEGYLMHNSDTYTGDAYETSALCCYCGVYDFGNYGDPAYDLAPWWDPNRPESNGFFGMVPDIRLLSVATRTLTQRASGRGDIGPLTAAPRIIQVTGWLYADSAAAMSYGERWLSRMLAGGGAGCGGDTLTVLPACPPDDAEDPDSYLRDLARVGIIDGPDFTPADRGIPECTITKVTFQWAAGEPWLRKITPLLTIDLVANPTTCTPLEAPVIADAAAVITVQAGSSVLDGLTIKAYSGNCPGSGSPAVDLTISDMPANSRLVIDASTETVVLTNVAGTVIGGPDALDFTGILKWIKAAAGTNAAIQVDASGATGTTGATVEITAVDLEW